MKRAATNWVFLGDSLTEGVGSSRVSYVTELTRRLREAPGTPHGPNVHELRLRHVEPDGFNQFVRFNLAGHWNAPPSGDTPALWLWNLACEGRTIETDRAWLPLLQNLQPETVFVFRGSLESIMRPAALQQGRWPAWLPASWRGYAAMDPRCYFSSTWWRRLKQIALDALRQRARHHLLRREPGRPLMEADTLLARYAELVQHLHGLGSRVIILGLLPIDAGRFPGSPEQFALINSSLRELAARHGVGFFDWGAELKTVARADLFYRDGFHPNQAGAEALAELLSGYLATKAA